MDNFLNASCSSRKTTDEARTYTKKANRKCLSDSGLGKVERTKKEQNLSNPVGKLDIDASQELNCGSSGKRWYAQGESNPCYRRERAVS